MNTHAPSLRTWSFATPLALLLLVTTPGCGSLMQRTASLEDDELYLERGEEFITDAEYLAYAYEQAGYDAAGGDYAPRDSRGGDAFQSSFGYVPQSLRGRSMLRGYMTPYGAAGFGPNPYDPWGSSFYGVYSAYNPGFYDPYNPYGSPMGNLGWGSSAWGVNPYMGGSFGNGWGNSWGMNPYGYSPYGFNSYNPYNPYNPYGAGGWYGGGNNWGNAWGGGDVFDVNTVVVAPRTPIWTSSSINSNGGGGRLLTNKVDEVEVEGGTPAAPMTIWRGIDAMESKAASRTAREARTAPTSPTYPNPARTTPASNGRSSYGSGSNSGRSSYGTSNSSRTTTRPSSTRNSSSRNSSWSGSSSGSSRSSGSRPSTRPSSGRSSGSSSGRGSGSSRGGRGGSPSP